MIQLLHTLFSCTLLHLKSTLLSLETKYITTSFPICWLQWVIWNGFLWMPNHILQSNAVSSIKKVSVVCREMLNHWMKTDTSSSRKHLRKDLITLIASKKSDEAYALYLCSCRRVNKTYQQTLNMFLNWSSLVYSFRTKNQSLHFYPRPNVYQRDTKRLQIE